MTTSGRVTKCSLQADEVFSSAGMPRKVREPIKEGGSGSGINWDGGETGKITEILKLGHSTDTRKRNSCLNIGRIHTRV